MTKDNLLDKYIIYQIIAAMVMCIIASCVSAPVLAFGIIDAVLGYYNNYNVSRIFSYWS